MLFERNREGCKTVNCFLMYLFTIFTNVNVFVNKFNMLQTYSYQYSLLRN